MVGTLAAWTAGLRVLHSAGQGGSLATPASSYGDATVTREQWGGTSHRTGVGAGGGPEVPRGQAGSPGSGVWGRRCVRLRGPCESEAVA